MMYRITIFVHVPVLYVYIYTVYLYLIILYNFDSFDIFELLCNNENLHFKARSGSDFEQPILFIF